MGDNSNTVTYQDRSDHYSPCIRPYPLDSYFRRALPRYSIGIAA